MKENKLQLNNVRQKLFVSHHHPLSTRPCHPPQTVSLSNTDVEFSGTIHNLGFIFGSDLSVKQHVIKTCKGAYIEIRCISSIHQYFSEDITKTLVSSCILSKLDYCNSLLAGHRTTPTSTELCSGLLLKSRTCQTSAQATALAPHRTEN